MMKRLTTIAACLSLCMVALPAYASGGVMCQTEDESLAFDFSAGQSRDGAGDWFGIQGKLLSKIEHLPPDLASFVIGRDNLTEHWADRDSVRLEIEKQGDEKQNYANVRLTVMAIALEELTYKGPYLLRVQLPDGTTVTRDGSVACSAD